MLEVAGVLVGAFFQAYIVLTAIQYQIGWSYSFVGATFCGVGATVAFYYFYKTDLEHEKREKDIYKVIVSEQGSLKGNKILPENATTEEKPLKKAAADIYGNADTHTNDNSNHTNHE